MFEGSVEKKLVSIVNGTSSKLIGKVCRSMHGVIFLEFTVTAVFLFLFALLFFYFGIALVSFSTAADSSQAVFNVLKNSRIVNDFIDAYKAGSSANSITFSFDPQDSPEQNKIVIDCTGYVNSSDPLKVNVCTVLNLGSESFKLVAPTTAKFELQKYESNNSTLWIRVTAKIQVDVSRGLRILSSLIRPSVDTFSYQYMYLVL